MCFVVRIKAYHNNECIRYGTGIVLNDRTILTAAHVAYGDQHTVIAEEKEIQLSVMQETKTSVAALLMSEHPLPFQVADIFSVDEILDAQALWTVDGYITEGQCSHQIAGKGIQYGQKHDDTWDYFLVNINTGESDNYEGLSGAPVMSCGRIVGILQMQATNSNGRLGLRMASVVMFRGLLPAGVLKPNEYESLVLMESQMFSRKRVEDNKKSSKYIPDIFVEEGLHKEQLRYFSDPYLFVKKAIRDCKCIDFSSINTYLNEGNLKNIDFPSLSEEFLPDELCSTTQELSNFMCYTTESFEMRRKSSKKNDLSLERYFDFESPFNNSLRFYFEDLRELIEFVGLRYLLLTKRAGQGKTNFLCDFTQNFLLKKGYCVWYFNANELRENPMIVLQNKLSLKERYDPIYTRQVLESMWRRTGRPVIAIIDGLNENISIPDFEGCMSDFLEECSTMPFLKVIMSTREELLKERFDRLLQLEEQQIGFRHLNMKDTSGDFKNRIFKGYLRFFDITIRWNTLRGRTYDKLTENVLLLRFFCEVNQGTQQLYMYDIYIYDVFDKYLSKKAQEYQQNKKLIDPEGLFRSLLDTISKYMIENQTYFYIPTAEFNYEQQCLLNIALENDVIFKREEQIESGFLRHNAVVVSFTFDEFRDFCLTNYVLTSCYSKREKFMDFRSDMQYQNWTIREGVQKYIFYLSKTKYKEKLLPIVQDVPEYETLYWDYIWGVEDCYITGDDIARFKTQMLQDGKHARKVVKYLLFKYDRTYFTIANINLLFGVLDELSGDIKRYHKFVTAMFGIAQQDRYERVQSTPESVFSFDAMLKKLNVWVKRNELVLTHRECFRLSIYLYELAASRTQELWETLYLTSPEIVVELLQEMNGHISSLIKGNVKDILHGLLNHEKNDMYDLEIRCLNKANDFGRKIIDVAQAIEKIWGEGP